MSDATAGATPATPDLARQGSVIAALAATLAVNTAANLLPLNGQTTGEISDRFPVLITPPGYVFSIWGLIYTGLIAYAIYQALPSRRDDPRLRRVAWPFVLSCAANVAWLLLWHYNQFGLTLGAMLGLLFALIVVDRRLGTFPEHAGADLIFARLPFSVYLGWISVATIVNATVVLYDVGWDGLGLSPELWTTGLIGAGAGLAAAMGLRQRDPAYPLVIAWALAGVAGKNAGTPLVGPAAWAGAAVALLAAGAALLRLRRR